jgi:hypothetical protein
MNEANRNTHVKENEDIHPAIMSFSCALAS